MIKEERKGTNIMARLYRDECAGCPPEKGCLGSSCPYSSVEYLICDECGDEFEFLYDYDGEELCQDCLLNRFKLIRLGD